jgi:hypothetical protein
MDKVVNLLPDRIPVLVVDDDETVIQVTRLVLSRFRFENHALELICAGFSLSVMILPLFY